MPELAEVESARRIADAIARSRTVAAVWVDEGDQLVFTAPPATFADALLGARVTGTDRHGKYFWMTFDGRPSLLFHLGMTGSIRIPNVDTLRYKTGPKVPSTEWPPRFTKLCLTFDDGGQLAFTNARRLGRLRLVDDPRAEKPVKALGFDPYLQMPEPAAFAKSLRRRKTPLKAILLNQKFAAGVGNWIADEVLYQAGIKPTRRPPDLSDAEVEALRVALRDIVHTAVSVDAQSDRFPTTWLFHRRWGKDASATDAEGHPLRFDELAGRTTAWVPAKQR